MESRHTGFNSQNDIEKTVNIQLVLWKTGKERMQLNEGTGCIAISLISLIFALISVLKTGSPRYIACGHGVPAEFPVCNTKSE